MTYFKELKEVKTVLAGKEISIKTGQFAHQADGSVTVTLGDTVVMATASMGEAREGADFFPMMVDYEEKFYASGKISGSRFQKREGRPSEHAILSARLIDRPLRPLFPKGMNNDVQIICTVLSADLDNDAAILALNAASAALSISGMPFMGPVGAVRMGLVDGKLIVNPSTAEREVSELDLVVAGTKNAITMVEAGAKEVSREVMLEALTTAHGYIKELCALQEQLIGMVKPEPLEYSTFERDEELVEMVKAALDQEMVLAVGGMTKKDFKKSLKALEEDTVAKFEKEIEEEVLGVKLIKEVCLEEVEGKMRRMILEEGKRIDGRALDEIRPIKCDVSVLPRPHGSGVFQRGETQVLSIVTLGAPSAAQVIDSMEEDTTKSYIHHYNFPPYSVGEVRPLRGVGRREIGHGFLAERALEAVIPAKDVFPYTIRVVSETLACNGSSSMGSVCGSTLALMDAGVPLTSPVSGIAMGLVTDESTGEYKILTDIQGLEDFAGDMDFKVTGTTKGITALQMDIKLTGLSLELLREALEKGDAGRLNILEQMLAVIPEPRKEVSKYAPMIEYIQINPDFIRDVIGKGGETIQKITAETKCEIEIEQDGRVTITAPDGEACQAAIDMIKAIAFEPEIGQEFMGTVIRVEAYGAFVEIAPGKSGLVHISNIAPFRVDNVEALLEVGQQLQVRVAKIDDQGRIDLSHKEFFKGEKPA